MVKGDSLLVPIEHHCIATAFLSIVANLVHPFMDTFSDGYFEQDKALRSSRTGFWNMTRSSLISKGLHRHQISI